MGVWCAIVFSGKILVFIGELIWYKPLITMSIWLLSIFDGYPNTLLVFVMIVLPVTFNTI